MADEATNNRSLERPLRVAFACQVGGNSTRLARAFGYVLGREKLVNKIVVDPQGIALESVRGKRVDFARIRNADILVSVHMISPEYSKKVHTNLILLSHVDHSLHPGDEREAEAFTGEKFGHYLKYLARHYRGTDIGGYDRLMLTRAVKVLKYLRIKKII